MIRIEFSKKSTLLLYGLLYRKKWFKMDTKSQLLGHCKSSGREAVVAWTKIVAVGTKTSGCMAELSRSQSQQQ